MKKFIKHIIVFFGIVILISTFIGLFNYSRMRISPDLGNTEILFVGDSRIMTAINPDSLPGSKNIAQNSESYFISFYKLKALLVKNKNVKKIVLGFSYHNFSAYVDNIFSNDIATEDVLKRVYPIIKPGDFGEIHLDRMKYYNIFLKELLVYPHLNHQKYVGKFEALPYGLDKANLSSVILRHYYDTDTNNIGISCCAASYLDSIISLTHNNQIDLILVNIPLHKDYLARIPNNFIRYYNEQKLRMDSLGIPVLDYSNVQFPDKYFKDYNHLDLEGANAFTRMLKQDLGRREIITF